MQTAFILPLLEQIKSKAADLTGIRGVALDFAFALIIVLFFAVLAEVIYHLVYNVLPRVTARTRTKLDDELLKALQGPIRLLIIIIGLSLALHTIAFSYEQFKLIDQFFTVLAIFIGAYFVVKIIEGFARWYMMEVAPKTVSPIDDQLVPFLNRLFKIFVIAIAVLVALSAIGYEITPLIAGIGIAGIAIALAAQASLTDIFSSLNIMADRPYRVGDRIKFVGREDQKGDVIDIGIRSTRIKLEDDTLLVVPNSIMAREKIINENDPDPRLRLSLPIPVSYKADVDKVTSILLDAAAQTPGVVKEPSPIALIVEFGDYSMKMELRVWAENPRLWKIVPDRLYRLILKRFKEEGIEIPYPVRIVRKADDFELEFR
ncbi:MAG: mechanosensitive ion channel [Methanocellales archaeon]